jgi:hypothetical protein
MSPENEYLLLHDVVARLRSAIRIAVAHVGSEDDAELLQDPTPMAAKMFSDATRQKRERTRRPRDGKTIRGAYAAGVWFLAARRKHPHSA